MKYENGAFCFWRTTPTMQPMTPAEIERLAAQHNLPASIVPQYAGDRQQISRAIGAVSSKASKGGWQLTSIKTGRHEVVYGISAIEKDQAQERVDFTFDDRLRWSDEGGNGQHIEGMHAAQGILTSRGGRTSHAAQVARQFGKPAVVGVSALDIDLDKRVI